MIIFSILELYKIWLPESSLIEIKGNLRYINTDVKTVKSSRRTHQVIKLTFFLEGSSKKFVLTKNIREEWRDEEFLDFQKSLQSGKIIRVQIDKAEKDEVEPTVYSLSVGEHQLITLSDTKSDAGAGFIILFIFGIIFLAIPFFAKPKFRLDK